MKTYNFTVLIEKDEDGNGYIAHVPGVHGCHTVGDTIEDAAERIKEVIELMFNPNGDDDYVPDIVEVRKISMTL